jgi:hypothetical protein
MGVPHLHFELCQRGPCREYPDFADPLLFVVGCFDPARAAAYSALETSGGKPRLVLTYPIPCSGSKRI